VAWLNYLLAMMISGVADREQIVRDAAGLFWADEDLP
jgi:hypothetical protein